MTAEKTVATGMSYEPDTVEIANQTSAIERRAEQLSIKSADDYRDAAEFLVDVRRVVTEINDTFDQPIKDAHRAHKSMIKARDRHRDPLLEVERKIKGVVSSWTAEQEQQRRETERLEREKLQREEEERRLAAALELEESGDTQAADALIAEPVAPPVYVAPPAVPKVEGVGARTNWKFHITDPMQVPREFLLPDMVKIGQVVRAMKGGTKIPGVKAYPDTSVSVRA